jgi:hypothetical protein
MRWKHFTWILLPCLGLAQTPAQLTTPPPEVPAKPVDLAPPASPLDSGVLRIMVNGQVAGRESFEIEQNGSGYRARAEIKVRMPGGKEAVESAVLNVTHLFDVLSYTRLQKSPKKASVQLEFSGGQAAGKVITPEGAQDREYYLDPKVCILDTNFFHQYQLLPYRYDLKKGGVQALNIFIPQESFPGLLNLQYAGKEDGLHKWLAKAELEIAMWVDEQWRLMRLAVPAAKVEVLREVKSDRK